MSTKESGCAKDSPSESRPFGLDDILVKIGQFGKFQCIFFVLAFFLILFHTVLKYSFVFTSSPVIYRCRVPECDGSESLMYEQPWTEFSILKTAVGKLDNCQRYMALNSTINEQLVCSADNYAQKLKTDCGDDLIFRDDEFTISNDFQIFCEDEWKLAMVGTVSNLGQVFGIPLGGYFSDRYGRTKILAYGGFLSAIMGIVRSFSLNYYMFLALGFLDNIFGATIYGTVFILALEIIGPKYRVRFGSLLRMCAGISRAILAMTAMNFPNWRWIERIFYIPALAFIVMQWILPESFRWLLSQGKEEKAINILKNAAKINKRKLSDFSIDKLLASNRQNLVGADKKKFPLGEAFKLFPWRIINCSVCWFTSVFVFFGLNLNSALLGGNKYYNFMFVSLVEIPGTILPALTVDRFGRRYSLFGYLFLSGICIGGVIFVGADSHTYQLILNLLGKMLITASSHTLYVFTSEIFPTNARNGLLSFCSMSGRIGSMVSPQIPLLAKYFASAPAILFASTAFLSCFLVLPLPETKHNVLPATLQDANKIGQKEVKVEHETIKTIFVTKL